MNAGGATFLRVLDLEARYEDVILALRGVSLQVEEGAIVALLGPNGAGKTTTLKAISNLIRAERGRVSRGSILWCDEAIENADPSDLGFARGLSRVELNDGLERVYRWFPRLKERRKTRSGYTSGGEQQMTALGRALMTRPTLVLLDEPSMGLAPIVVAEIFEIIRRLNRDEGVTFLLAEQNANLALKYARHAYILENGRVALSGPAAELASREDVHEFYFGAASVGETKSPIQHLDP